MFHYYDQTTTDEEGWGSFPGERMENLKKKKEICNLN